MKEYDPATLVDKLGYNPYAIPTVPLGATCRLCEKEGIGFSWRDCLHFGGYPSNFFMEGRKPSPERYNELKRWVAEHKRKRKAIFRELNFSIKSQLAAFRRDVIIPIIESIEDSVRLNKQLNLALSGRHSRFQDNSMDLSEPRRQFPEVVVETVPLFPLELPSKDILEIEVMIEHISDILLFLCDKFGHTKMDLNVYFASHTTPIYAYLTASSKLRIHSPILFAKWRFIDLIHDDELQSEAGRVKDHGYHRIHVLE